MFLLPDENGENDLDFAEIILCKIGRCRIVFLNEGEQVQSGHQEH